MNSGLTFWDRTKFCNAIKSSIDHLLSSPDQERIDALVIRLFRQLRRQERFLELLIEFERTLPSLLERERPGLDVQQFLAVLRNIDANLSRQERCDAGVQQPHKVHGVFGAIR